MKFSILIAHYNNFEFFLDCYQYIINQSFQNFEVIIVDDFSTDGSFEKLKNFLKNDFRFKLYQNEKNKGVGYTKRRCVELANGDICGFVDPDDGILPNALDTILQNYTPNIIAVYSQNYFCDEYLKPQYIYKANTKIKNGNPFFFNIFFEVNHFFTFRKKSYLKTSGINPNLRIAEDQDLYLKLYEQGDFKFVEQPLYLYRRHKKGLSQDINKEKIERKKNDWTTVLIDTLKRRNIPILYGKKIENIKNLQDFIYKKQNTFIKKLERKLKKLL